MGSSPMFAHSRFSTVTSLVIIPPMRHAYVNRVSAGITSIAAVILLSAPLSRAQETRPVRPPSNEAKTAAIQARIGVIDQLLQENTAEDYIGLADSMKSRGRFDEAALYYLVAEKMKPENPQCRYQLACTFSMWGQKQLALNWLQKSVDAGFWGSAMMEQDSDLKSIRTDPAFATMLAVAMRRYEQEAPKHAGKTIIAVPAGLPPKDGWPVVVLLHGFGDRGESYQNFAEVAAANGLAGVAPSGPIVLDDGHFSWGNDALATHKYVQKQLDAYRERKDLDFNRVFVAGFSQGAMHAGVLLATRPDSYRGGLSISPGGEPGVPAEMAEPKLKRPLYLVGGHAEHPITLGSLDKFENLWKANGFPVERHWHDGGHTFPPDWKDVFAKALHWMEENAAG
ncbi:MAG: hypothetical protein JWN51_3596 [Phycisphaerales bacterium]|nr:hypothetical protein [Phycisphaerales bacterium]